MAFVRWMFTAEVFISGSSKRGWNRQLGCSSSELFSLCCWGGGELPSSGYFQPDEFVKWPDKTHLHCQLWEEEISKGEPGVEGAWMLSADAICSSCSDHYLSKYLFHDGRKCQIPHVCCADGPQWPRLCIYRARRRPLVLHICRRFEAFQKHQPHCTHGAKLKPVMKKLFQLGSLLSVNPRQMLTFRTCHHAALPESQGDVCGEMQMEPAPPFPSRGERALRGLSELNGRDGRRSLWQSCRQLWQGRKHALKVDLIQAPDKEQAAKSYRNPIQDQHSTSYLSQKNHVFRKICHYRWI